MVVVELYGQISEYHRLHAVPLDVIALSTAVPTPNTLIFRKATVIRTLSHLSSNLDGLVPSPSNPEAQSDQKGAGYIDWGIDNHLALVKNVLQDADGLNLSWVNYLGLFWKLGPLPYSIPYIDHDTKFASWLGFGGGGGDRSNIRTKINTKRKHTHSIFGMCIAAHKLWYMYKAWRDHFCGFQGSALLVVLTKLSWYISI